MLKPIKILSISTKEVKTFSKNGKTWTATPIGIKTLDKDGQEVWINGLATIVPNWQIGDEAMLEVWKDEKYGLQFRLPRIEDRLAILEKDVSDIKKSLKAPQIAVSSPPEASDEVDVNNLPF